VSTAVADPAPTVPDAVVAAHPARRRHLALVLLSALVVLAVAEGAVRARASSLPEPRRWSGPEMQVKEDRIAELEAAGGALVVLLGSSTVDAALDPSRMAGPGDGRPVYNAATGAGSIDMISTWAREVAVPRLRPHTVVLGLASRELTPHDTEQQRHTAEFFDSPAVRHLTDREPLLDRVERRLSAWSYVVRYRNVLRQPHQLWGSHRTGEFGEVVAADGQFEGFRAGRYVPSPEQARFVRRILRDYEIGRHQLGVLRDLLAHLRSHVERVVVVNMPVTADYVSLHPRGARDYDAYVDVLRAEADRAGAELVDAGVWPDELFADTAHVNGAGSQRLTALVDEHLLTKPPR
jgi:hypothetical protein